MEIIHKYGVKSPEPHIDLDDDIISKLTLYDHQIEGAEAILSAFDNEHKGFLLGDDVGTGKTFTCAAAVAQMKPKRAIISVPSDGVKKQWIRTLEKVGIKTVDAVGTTKDFSKVKGVLICTDTTLAANSTLHDSDADLVIFDEAHRMKAGNNTVLDSNRFTAGQNLVQRTMKKDGKILYATATPYERPWQAKIYEALEMWEPGEFDRWVAKHGVKVNQRRITDPVTMVTSIESSYALKGNGKQAVKRTLMSHIRNISQGCFLAREVQPEGVVLSNHFHKTELDPETDKQYKFVMNFMNDAIRHAQNGADAYFLAGQRTLWARRFMESAKLPEAVRIAKSELMEGRKVAIMTGYKNAANIEAFADKVHSKIDYLNPGAWAVFKDTLKALGEKIEGTFDTLKTEFPNAAIYSGGLSAGAREAAKHEYNYGSKNVLIATQAAADTGIDLHDTIGTSPRSQINVTIPWTAIQTKQLSGRSYRLGTKSDTKMHWLFGDDAREKRNAQLVSKKMEIMGASSAGIDVSDSDDLYKRLVDFDMADGTGIDYGGYRPKVMKKSLVNHIIKIKKFKQINQ